MIMSIYCMDSVWNAGKIPLDILCVSWYDYVSSEILRGSRHTSSKGGS